jgi:hypothetical protein
MPIEIEIKTTDKDYLIIDGFYLGCKEDIKPKDILDKLEYMGYVTIKVTEE